jgi:hypothetical protein
MELNGWTWSIAGIIMTVMSGYVYLFIPKNGGKNTAMAIFFFIGIVFLIIGITKLFFRRIDDKSVMDSLNKQPPEQKIVTMPTMENKPNRVEERINQMVQEQERQESQAKVNTATASMNGTPSGQKMMHNQHQISQHTNSFSNIYQYSGPVHNPSAGVHAQHPVSQHTGQSTINATPHQTEQHHPVQNTIEHGIKCRKCGNVNAGHANYCHGCGNRLK